MSWDPHSSLQTHEAGEMVATEDSRSCAGDRDPSDNCYKFEFGNPSASVAPSPHAPANPEDARIRHTHPSGRNLFFSSYNLSLRSAGVPPQARTWEEMNSMGHPVDEVSGGQPLPPVFD